MAVVAELGLRLQQQSIGLAGVWVVAGVAIAIGHGSVDDLRLEAQFSGFVAARAEFRTRFLEPQDTDQAVRLVAGLALFAAKRWMLSPHLRLRHLVVAFETIARSRESPASFDLRLGVRGARERHEEEHGQQSQATHGWIHDALLSRPRSRRL